MDCGVGDKTRVLNRLGIGYREVNRWSGLVEGPIYPSFIVGFVAEGLLARRSLPTERSVDWIG